MRIGIYGTLLASLLIAGCTSSPRPEQPPLAERLAGKSPQDRQEILGLACLDEVERLNSTLKHTRRQGTTRVNDPFNPARGLCLRMTVAYLSSDTKKHATLAQQCKQQILPAINSDSSFLVEHAHKMQEACEELTGQKIIAP